MNDRQIIQGPGAGADAPASPATPLSGQGPSRTLNLPIAAALPAWDLLPADTLLVRRKAPRP